MIVIGDIDRGGGVFASLYGTVGLLDDDDRQLITAFLINKFRGDLGVLQPGLDELSKRTGVPFAGVLPWLANVWLDAEDTLEVAAWRRRGAADGALRVAVVRLPRMSNGTDVEALAAEPGVEVLVTTDVRALTGADLVILPGTRSTVGDLDWLHRTGISQVIQARAQRSAPVLGICGGYQMLAAVIDDPIESGRGVVKGSACCQRGSVSDPTRCWAAQQARGVGTRLRRTKSTMGLLTSRVRLNCSSTAVAADRSGARCGTGPGRTTVFDAPGWPRSPRALDLHGVLIPRRLGSLCSAKP